MGIAISTSREDVWIAQSWLGLWVLELARDRCGHNREAINELEMAEFVQGVSLGLQYERNREVALVTLRALQNAIMAIESGEERIPWETRSWNPVESPEDEAGVMQHIQKLKDVLNRFPIESA